MAVAPGLARGWRRSGCAAAGAAAVRLPWQWRAGPAMPPLRLQAYCTCALLSEWSHSDCVILRHCLSTEKIDVLVLPQFACVCWACRALHGCISAFEFFQLPF